MMRAVEYDAYGPPSVLRVRNVPIPQIGPEDVLVRVHGANVGGGETAIRAGKIRVMTGRKFPRRLGNDFAGEIVMVGEKCTKFRPGDRVWGLKPHMQFGAIADFVAVPAERVAMAPSNFDLVEASSLPAVGTTTIRALTREGGLKSGERLLIRGASGGVGSVAIQLGKAMDAHVTGIAGKSSLSWVKELGADEAVDYANLKPDGLGRFDVILDLVGKGMEPFRQLLSPGGRMVGLAYDPDHLFRTLMYLARTSLAGSKRVRAFSNDPTQNEIVELTRLVENGTIEPHVSRTWDIHDVAHSHRLSELGGVRGNQVVQLL